MSLTPDMSMREILAAVTAGQVILDGRERSADIGHVWVGPDGVAFAGPWDPTGRRLDFLSRRGIITIRRCGEVELTTAGWRRFEQLVTRRLAARERERLFEAAALSSYAGRGLPPRRWLSV